jgi:hypothetical protein
MTASVQSGHDPSREEIVASLPQNDFSAVLIAHLRRLGFTVGVDHVLRLQRFTFGLHTRIIR